MRFHSVLEKKKSLSFRIGTAYRIAKLVAGKVIGRDSVARPAARLTAFDAFSFQVLEARAEIRLYSYKAPWILIGAGLGDQVDDTAAGTTVLRVEAVGDYAVFLNRIERDLLADSGIVVIFVLNAIQENFRARGALPGKRSPPHRC